MTGNLYNLEISCILEITFIQKKKNVDVITADGGFDFSIDFNNQEQLSHKLIFVKSLQL